MIGQRVAKKLAIRFLKEEGCHKLVIGLRYGDCLDSTFARAVRTLGKKRVAELYKRLPKPLKIYLLWDLTPKGDKRFHKKFMELWEDYTVIHGRDRPDRCREFKSYYRRAEKALLKYLEPR